MMVLPQAYTEEEEKEFGQQPSACDESKLLAASHDVVL